MGTCGSKRGIVSDFRQTGSRGHPSAAACPVDEMARSEGRNARAAGAGWPYSGFCDSDVPHHRGLGALESLCKGVSILARPSRQAVRPSRAIVRATARARVTAGSLEADPNCQVPFAAPGVRTRSIPRMLWPSAEDERVTALRVGG